LPSKNYIQLVELFAGPVALDTFADEIRDQPVIHFVDNNGALGSLVKGYSNKIDTIQLVAEYWIRAAALKAYMYIDRVESDSNISDDPSRMNVEGVMEHHKAEYRSPKLGSFEKGECTSSPLSWFGGQIQWERMMRFVEASRQAFGNPDSSHLIRPTNTLPAWSEGISLLS